MSDVESLVRQAQKGERSAVEALLEQVTQRVYAISYHFMTRPQDAEEAAQEALVRIFTRLSELRNPSRFAAWCATLTANLCRDRLRKKRVAELPFEDAEQMAGGDDPAGSAAARETSAQLAAALGCLSPALRLVFLLREVEGMSTEEVAGALEIPSGTVKSRLFEARRQLRDLLIKNEVVCS